jgi:hypothetical protein
VVSSLQKKDPMRRGGGSKTAQTEGARNDNGEYRAWDGKRWQPVPPPLPPQIGMLDDLLPGTTSLSDAQRRALEAVQGDTSKLSVQDYGSILSTVSGWRDFHIRLPDGQPTRVTAPNLDVAESIMKQHWADQGGWLNHPWTKWALGILLPIAILYALGWTVGWIVSGFRRRSGAN